MFISLTRKVLSGRNLVLLVWGLIAVLGFLANSRLDENLTTSLEVPGSDSDRATSISREYFNSNSEGTFTVVYEYGKASEAEIETMKANLARAVQVIRGGKVVQQRTMSGTLIANVFTPFDLVGASAYTTTFRNALDQVELSNAKVTGPPAIKTDVTPILDSDLTRGQISAVVIALALLLLFLGFSLAIFLPILFAAATLSASIALIYLISQFFPVMLYTPNVVELIGLGLAIDYSLLVIHRLRRELVQHDFETSLYRTMDSAGRTIILSGLSVTFGLATLFFVPVPFVRSLGAAAVLVPIISMLAMLTLQPALLSLLGKRFVTPRGFSGLMWRQSSTDGVVARFTKRVMRRPVATLITSIILLSIIALPALSLKVTPSSLTSLPAEIESAQALSVLTSKVGTGVITPNEIVIDLGASGDARTAEIDEARLALADEFLKDEEIFIVATDTTPTFIDESGRYLRMYVIGRSSFGAEASQELVKRIRSEYFTGSKFPAGAKLYLGGAPAQGVDLLHAIFTAFPIMFISILIFSYLILMRWFRSLLLPAKAIALDLLSIAVALGALVLVFRDGLGANLLGTYQLEQIEAWVMIFTFAILFGLSMDYEVFLVSRMREAWDQGKSNDEAIVEGMTETLGVVTAAAFIFVGAVSGLISGHFAGLQEIGVGLSIAVLLDATLIRLLLLPSAMKLFGRWNWWLPNHFVTRIEKWKAGI